jgi:D-inositol-3-phosphate glycosyltransferase
MTATQIVHVSAHYPPYLGGLEKVVESLAAIRKMQGLEVSVLTSREGRPKANDIGDADIVRQLWSWEVAHTPIIPGLLRELLRLPRSSVVHLHIAQAFVPEAVYAAHLISGLPYVAHFHLDVAPSGPAGFLLKAYKPVILRRVLRAAETVIVFTEDQRLQVSSKYGVDIARISVIPNGVDERFLNPGERSLHARPRLLFVGRLSPQKNLFQLFQALDGISEQFETTLVGEGEQEVQLKLAARRLGLKNLHFHGRADGDEVRELYQNADIFVLPSEREGMPLVLLEALAMGLPVVATDVAGNRDVIADGHNGFLVPLGDATAMRNALLSASSDQGTYKRMSEASLRLANRYSWKAVGAELEKIYAHATPIRR